MFDLALLRMPAAAGKPPLNIIGLEPGQAFFAASGALKAKKVSQMPAPTAFTLVCKSSRYSCKPARDYFFKADK